LTLTINRDFRFATTILPTAYLPILLSLQADLTGYFPHAIMVSAIKSVSSISTISAPFSIMDLSILAAKIGHFKMLLQKGKG